ncbi:MAG: type II toxin-antitoxin system VapC family toxin [Pseudomonadota bacterium]
MQLLLDTHIIVWIVLNDSRLSDAQRRALEDPENAILVSPVTAYELTQLQKTHRIPLSEPIDRLGELIGFALVNLPQDIWRVVTDLPDIHRDPVDRMLIAHALSEGMTLVTADANIRRYPVSCI